MAKFGWKQRAVILPPILLGILIIAIAPSMKAEPAKAEQKAIKKVVRVLPVKPRSIQPYAIGYGHTKPEQSWQAQSEVEGSIIWIAESLQNGAIIKKGTTLIKLDPSPYQLAITRLLAEKNVSLLRDKTIAASLAIAEQDYAIQLSEYQRTERLNKTGHISKNELDGAKRSLLNSQQQLQTLKNNLAINQAEQQVLQAQLDLAKRDLQKTEIVAPFDLRITEKKADVAEYVNKGEILLYGDGINRVEVSAQFPLGKMRPLRRSESRNLIDNNIHNDLQAQVILKAGDRSIFWQADVGRSGGQIDVQTQSQSIIVTIDAPYKKASPGKKPALIRDTFVKVILKAPVINKQILLPLTAIHQDKVYTVTPEGKLSIKPVEIDFIQGEIAVIKSGISFKDKVVLSQLSPAVSGMNLKPQLDKKMLKWLDNETGFSAEKAIGEKL